MNISNPVFEYIEPIDKNLRKWSYEWKYYNDILKQSK